MNKTQLTELSKIHNIFKNELLSQNYNESDEMIFNKSIILNLNTLLETIIEEQKLSVDWLPTQFGYSIENNMHKFYLTINNKEYSFFLTNNEIIETPINDLLHKICTFLIDSSLLNELKKNMLNNVKIAKQNANLIK
jgi:glutathionyl-hydroquinone reductase